MMSKIKLHYTAVYLYNYNTYKYYLDTPRLDTALMN